MNKITKGCLLGLIVFGSMEIGDAIGKGWLLGYMAKHNVSGSDVIEILSSRKEPKIKFVRSIANLKMQKEES